MPLTMPGTNGYLVLHVDSTAATTTETPIFSVAAGKTALLFITQRDTSAVVSVSDLTRTWTFQEGLSATSVRGEIWRYHNDTALPTTNSVVITHAGSSRSVIVAAEYGGMDTSSPWGNRDVKTGGTTSTSITAAGSNGRLIAQYSGSGAPVATSDASDTKVGSANTTGGGGGSPNVAGWALHDNTDTVAGSVFTTAGTWSFGNTGVQMGLEAKAAGGSEPPPPAAVLKEYWGTIPL